MIRSLIVAGLSLIAASCSADRLPPAVGQVIAPTAVATASAGDRDVLFIASSGNDELRALQICTRPLLNSARDPADTCPAREDFQFVPGPVRIFAASIPSGERPIRLAGVRLCVPAPGATDCAGAPIIGGAVLAAGADPLLHVVDARNLIQAMDKVAPAYAPSPYPLDRLAADVIAFNQLDGVIEQPSPVGRVYVALPATRADPARLVALDVSLDVSGRVQTPVFAGGCTFADVDPRRLALVPGSNALLYVADGKGNGALRVPTTSLTSPPGSCPIDRISSFGRPLRSIALNPVWYADPKVLQNAGEILAGVTVDGALLFARTGDGALFGVPPSPWDGAAAEPMEPLSPGALLSEVAFLSTPPSCEKAPCTPVWVGPATTGGQQFNNLVAVASSTDGSAYYFDVLNRRVLNQTLYLGGNWPATDVPVVTPASTTLSLAIDPTTSNPEGKPGTPGVTRSNRWRTVFHSSVPGLERRGGTVTVKPDGTMDFVTAGIPFRAWTQGVIALRNGDVVSPFFTDKAACPELGDQISLQYELPILNVVDDATLKLGPVPGFSPPTTCKPFAMVGEVRAVADQPWTVYEGADLRGRFRNGVPFQAMGKRFDYPIGDLQLLGGVPPLRATDIAMKFHLNGPDPAIGTQISFNVTSGITPVIIRDPTAPQGLATAVLPYSYAKVTNLTYVTVTGANVLLQAAAELPAGAIIAYR